jgi:PmbA protein
MESLLGICERAVERALAAGADDAEAYAVRGKNVEVQLQKNDIQIAKSMTSDGLGIRVFRNRSLGFAFANSFGDDDIRESAERALGIAAAAPPDEHNGLPDPTPLKPVLGISDPKAERFGVEAAVEQALAMLHTAREFDSRVTVDWGGLTGQHGTKAIVSSRGVRAEETGSSYYCLIMGMATEGEVISSFDYQFESSRMASGIDPVAVARKFAENVVSTLGAVKGESFKGPVILSPKAAAEILAYPICVAVRASSVQRETSRFAGKLGEAVASALVTVVDDSSLKDGLSTTSFDREGLKPLVLPVIEGGVLRNFLYDAYTARKDGRSSTGHAGGGAGSVPSVATTNVVWSAGDTPLADMVSGIDKGLLVTRFSGNVDPVSGDFSGSVKGGHMIRGGSLAEPLCGTMIAGNTFELLPGVSAVSQERERLFSDDLPYVRLDGVAVSSG